MTPLTQATPLQLAEHQRHRERMHRMNPARSIVPPVIALPPVDPDPTPPDAIHVPWTGRVDMKRITEVVADHFGITRRDIYSRRRTAKIVLPRQIAMYLAKTVTLKSLPEIGRQLGGRDHTTVLHAVRKVEALASSKPEFAAIIVTIKASMGIRNDA